MGLPSDSARAQTEGSAAGEQTGQEGTDDHMRPTTWALGRGQAVHRGRRKGGGNGRRIRYERIEPLELLREQATYPFGYRGSRRGGHDLRKLHRRLVGVAGSIPRIARKEAQHEAVEIRPN